MIVGEELRRWATDRQGRHATRAAIEAVIATWPNGPIHQRFVTTIAQLPDKTGAAITGAMLAFFQDHGWIDGFVGEVAAAMRSDPFFVPPFRALSSAIHSGLLLYEDNHVQIALGVSQATRLAAKKSRAAAGSIHFTGQVSVLKFIHAGGATLSFWEASRSGDGFSAATAGKCRQTGVRTIRDGETLVLDGRAQSYLIEHATTNLLLLQAIIKTDQAPLRVEYDAAAGTYAGCGAVEDTDSRIQMIATLARKLGHADAFAALLPHLDHPRFFVRWHVMRELIGIDARAALPHLAGMAARDPHPEVRKAADTTLDRLNGAGLEREAA